MVSGGSAANLTALLTAIRTRAPADADRRELVVYVSEEAHFSVAKAAAALGVSVRRVPVDAAWRLDVPALARGVGLSSGHLSRRFRQAYGEAPYSYLMTRRIERAMALLRAGVGPAEVAARTGYADQPHLSRDVRAFAGVSPARVAPAHPR